jgi:hypothetical protein
VVGYWVYKTRSGSFYIRPTAHGFAPFFEDEHLGTYQSPAQALDDLVGGHTFSPSNGVETDEVGLPDDLSKWTFVRLR